MPGGSESTETSASDNVAVSRRAILLVLKIV